MESTLAHEMVHAFDHCRFKFNHGDLKHVACAEVSSLFPRECLYGLGVEGRFGRWHYHENVGS
jgi:hypothetical protein